MNEDGFFTTVQVHEPGEPYSMRVQEGVETVPGLAMWTPHVFGRVQDIRDIAETSQLIHAYGSFHSLYADATGDAMVLELIGNEVIYTNIEGKFLVMTNFPNAYLADTPLETLQKIPYGGVDRYEAAYHYIEEHVDTFTAEDGLAALELAVNKNYYSPTAYSVVFDPSNQSIYLTIRADYEHVWRVKMDERVVESHKGFDNLISLDIDDEGINLKTLAAYANAE